MRLRVRWLSFFVGIGLVAGCNDPDPDPPAQWQLVRSGLPGALLSVWGTGPEDVWAVGADARDGTGPTVIHYDGDAWSGVPTGQGQGDLWWVFGFNGGPIYMGGDGGVILRYDGSDFTLMDTPGTETVFGIWGASPDDVWAVGGASASAGGFAWRLSGDTWTAEPSVPADVTADAAIWKMFGASANDAWAVGSNGVALHWDGTAFTPGVTGVGSSLFTVSESEGLYTAVGGTATGFIVELAAGGTWTEVTPQPPPMGLAGVALGADGTGIAVGSFGAVYTRSASGWAAEDHGLPVQQNLHGAWIDDAGGLWAVGGQTLAPPLTDGVLLHFGPPVTADGP